MDITISNLLSEATDTLLNVFIPNAYAEGGAAQQSAGFADFIPLILLFVIFYFMLIRPQMKRAKEHKKLVEELAKGDEIVTNGGMVGKVRELGENFILVEIASGTEAKFQRSAVTAVLPKGTIKAL